MTQSEEPQFEEDKSSSHPSPSQASAKGEEGTSVSSSSLKRGSEKEKKVRNCKNARRKKRISGRMAKSQGRFN